MIITGKVRGAAARKYYEYCYRIPVKTGLCIYSVDPTRIDPFRAYPRCDRTSAYSTAPEIVEVADYEAVIGPMNEKGESRLSITMLPNEYTQARVPLVVYEMTIHGLLPNFGFCIDEVRECAAVLVV